MTTFTNVTVNPSWTHNGPVCPTCRRGYIGQHTCSPAILRGIIDHLSRRIDEIEQAEVQRSARTNADYARGCPCNPANGGSGVCGCILGGPQITC